MMILRLGVYCSFGWQDFNFFGCLIIILYSQGFFVRVQRWLVIGEFYLDYLEVLVDVFGCLIRIGIDGSIMFSQSGFVGCFDFGFLGYFMGEAIFLIYKVYIYFDFGYFQG